MRCITSKGSRRRLLLLSLCRSRYRPSALAAYRRGPYGQPPERMFQRHCGVDVGAVVDDLQGDGHASMGSLRPNSATSGSSCSSTSASVASPRYDALPALGNTFTVHTTHWTTWNLWNCKVLADTIVHGLSTLHHTGGLLLQEHAIPPHSPHFSPNPGQRAHPAWRMHSTASMQHCESIAASVQETKCSTWTRATATNVPQLQHVWEEEAGCERGRFGSGH